jgi:hypothetical protein
VAVAVAAAAGQAIQCELDLTLEAKNAEASARLLRGRGNVRIPRVVWELTRKSVLTMEYMPGLLRVTAPAALTARGLDLGDCGAAVADTLTELALCHGHVHGDPHAGNIYLACGPAAGWWRPRPRPRVVVLDHGLYHELDDGLRTDLCQLYLACLSRDRREIGRLGERCAGPLHRFFPLLLSPWFVLGTALSREDVRAARENKLPPSVTGQDVTAALKSLHNDGGNVLGVLHSFGYVRGLLNALGFSERRRLQSIARFATLGLAPPDVRQRALERGDAALPLYWRVRLARARVDVEVTAAMLAALSVTCATELDAGGCGVAFVMAAQAALDAGRAAARAVPWVRRAVRRMDRHCKQAEEGGAGWDGASTAGESVADSGDDGREEGGVGEDAASRLGRAREGRWGWMRERDGGGWGLRGLVSGLTRRATQAGAAAVGAAAGDGAKPRRARRLRHHSPSRAGANPNRRPWV